MIFSQWSSEQKSSFIIAIQEESSIFPSSYPAQRLFQEPPAESKFLAATRE